MKNALAAPNKNGGTKNQYIWVSYYIILLFGHNKHSFLFCTKTGAYTGLDLLTLLCSRNRVPAKGELAC